MIITKKFEEIKPKMDIKTCTDNLKFIKSLLNKYNVDPFLVFGTLLGAVRDKNFIKGDHDTDIAILLKDKDRLIAALESEEFKKSEIHITRIFPSLISITKNDEYIDIYIFSEENDKYWCKINVGTYWNKYYVDKFQLDNPSTIEFIGETFKTVNNPILYIEQRYGKNWRVPQNKTAPF